MAGDMLGPIKTGTLFKSSDTGLGRTKFKVSEKGDYQSSQKGKSWIDNLVKRNKYSDKILREGVKDRFNYLAAKIVATGTPATLRETCKTELKGLCDALSNLDKSVTITEYNKQIISTLICRSTQLLKPAESAHVFRTGTMPYGGTIEQVSVPSTDKPEIYKDWENLPHTEVAHPPDVWTYSKGSLVRMDGRVYTFQSALGKGSFGQAFLVVDETGKKSVIKVQRTPLQIDKDQVVNEYNLQAMVSECPNVASVYGIPKSGSSALIHMEYIEGTALRDADQARSSKKRARLPKCCLRDRK